MGIALVLVVALGTLQDLFAPAVDREAPLDGTPCQLVYKLVSANHRCLANEQAPSSSPVRTQAFQAWSTGSNPVGVTL